MRLGADGFGRLSLTMPERLGVFQRTELTLPDGNKRVADARYYHFRVGNHARWPKATAVQVYLLQIEDSDAAGAPRVTWSGELPFVWQHQAIYPLARDIGADFLAVGETKWVSLLTTITTYRFPVRPAAGGFPGRYLLRSSHSADRWGSKAFKVSWDKQWDRSEHGMAHHLVIEQLR
jgi:hypothetical protein